MLPQGDLRHQGHPHAQQLRGRRVWRVGVSVRREVPQRPRQVGGAVDGVVQWWTPVLEEDSHQRERKEHHRHGDRWMR